MSGSSEPALPRPALDGRGVTASALVAGIIRRWQIVVGTTLAAVVFAVMLMLLVPATYRSEASFVAGSSLRLPSNLAGLAAQIGVSPGTDPGESPAFYAQLIVSRELLTRLMGYRVPSREAGGDSVPLLSLFSSRSQEPAKAVETALKRARAALRVNADLKTNMVTVSVDTRWPDVSAAVANRVVDLVGGFNIEHRQSRARNRRIFIESRIAVAQRELDMVEGHLRSFLEQNRQWQQSPALTFEEGRIRRQVDVARDVFLTLRREFETARIEEVNDAHVITVVDSAIASRKPSWPRPIAMIVVAGFIGVFLGVFAAAVGVLVNEWSATDDGPAAVVLGAVRQTGREMRRLFERGRRGTSAVHIG